MSINLGFTFNGRHSSELGLYIRTKSNPLLPNKRIVKETVMGKDGSYIFEDGYEDKELEFECTLLEDDLETRRLMARDIAEWLVSKGDLILDYESDKKYIVIQTVNNIDLAFENGADIFDIKFVCEPFQYSVIENEGTSFDNPIGDISIINSGSHKVLPVIEITGTGAIIIESNNKSFIYSNLNGTVYVDCENYIVYSGNPKVNKLSNFSGDFINLIKGENIVNVTGTITNIKFIYRNTYI
ncbi:MAG: phage tail family protein [Vallitaleaceae bacterium]|nr:phage tail family protein [Vallitaleaceae bacterium]